ncbi:GNAT family N-acetyltransferase [Rufibacter hautae]|uniref:N-acetyltransferase domain-containing protein n=1 Tax=Rufibacter hautae TaxID=2595005 RepID=A0A5B6TD86_9BACT|nr:hypothetical protein [Rufibacter hautae]KAA3436949.1 hypothetical protein FOA19_21475 [Rufibacter hautae]
MWQVVPVNSKRLLKAFIDFPHQLFQGDPNYVPELFLGQWDLLTPGKHPFHEHSAVQPFLACEGKKIVGRIAAVLNRNHNQTNNEKDGFFGFFDCIDNQDVANLMFSEVAKWLKTQGAETMIGPVNPSTNETCGMLVEGFDSPPVVMMTYNKPYYLRLLENAGLNKKVDLIAYQFTQGYNERPFRMTKVLEERLDRKGIKIRKISLKNFKEEVAKIREVYNKAWDQNLGFVPMTPQEFDHMAKDMKMILDPDFCMVAEHEGEIIGFSLSVPDINQILINVKKGRLLPTGIFKLLFKKKKINGLRIIALGVLEGYRKLGIEACFYGHAMEQFKKKNMKMAEASWILENNTLMNQGLLNMDAKPYKKYRIYQKAI